MKSLEKMLLINWHYFSHTMVEFKMLNFLTGQNAAGKSTLIDALQVVMLGETRSHIFNKAANDKSERTLVGYLKGELGDDGGTGYRYLRDGDFNAYIVLEFFDHAKDKSFLTGVVFDVYGDGTQKHSFFIANDCAIPEHGFLDQGMPLNRTQLKQTLKTISHNKFSFYESQNTYRQHLMAKCGNIKHKFFSLFKKAVPFSPISDIESFITEYITDIKGRPNIEEMQQNLRYYKRLENDAETIQNRILRLEAIQKYHDDFLGKKRLQKIHEIVSGFAGIRDTENQLLTFQKEFTAHELNLTETKARIVTLKAEKEKLELQRDAITSEKLNSDIQKKLNSLEASLQQEQEKLTDYMVQIRKTIDRVRELANDYTLFLNDETSENIMAQTLYFSKLTINTLTNETFQRLELLNGHIASWLELSQRRLYECEHMLHDLEQEIRDLTESLRTLEKGVKPYPEHVIKLMTALKASGLKEVAILADVIDVTEDRWKNAIEAYLHTQKFYLLVEDSEFEHALEIYDSLKRNNPIYGVGLIDLEKIRKLKPSAREGSLACFVTTEHSGAKAFIDYVLGGVMACDEVKAIRQHAIGITDTCMLYQNYVARQLHPDRWRIPYIGRKAIEQQIKLVMAELEASKKMRKSLEGELVDLKSKCKIKAMSEHEMTIHEDSLMKLDAFKRCQQKIEALNLEKSQLDLSYIMKLEDELNAVKVQIKTCDDDINTAYGTQQGLIIEMRHISDEKMPQVESKIAQKKAFVDQKAYDEVRIEGLERIEKLLLDQRPEQIEINYARSAKAAGTDKEKLFESLTRQREEYNRVFHMSHDIHEEGNAVYANALKQLEETNLPDYLTKIKSAKEKTSDQFRDEFLAKLKENFDTVFTQIKELNMAIKDSPFGADSYRFEVKPKPEMRLYYDMIMDDLLLKDGMSIMSYAFNQKHHEAIEELFRMIVDIGEDGSMANRSMLEKNILYYTDYRSYLNFDLVVTDENGSEQRLSKTLLKKSGGETQTPFYLSVLASFAQMYRINHSGSNSETIRLIIFDEAFSKMDQQRIEESLKLLRRFQLQAIISAPPDKIVDITPHVDQNLCVFRENDISFVQSFERKVLLQLSQ